MGNKNSQAEKIKWVIVNYFEKDKSRPEAVKGLIDKYSITYNYARTLVYNHLCYLDWDRAPYPKNRKSRKNINKKDILKDKFKVSDKSDMLKEESEDEIFNDFEF